MASRWAGAALLLPLLVAACGGGHGAPPPAKVAGAEVIGCALAPGAALAPDCAIERSDTADGQLLVLRHPDGGFRRLLVSATGVVAADGAERAAVRVTGAQEIEVAIAGERYRLPATLRGGALTPP